MLSKRQLLMAGTGAVASAMLSRNAFSKPLNLDPDSLRKLRIIKRKLPFNEDGLLNLDLLRMRDMSLIDSLTPGWGTMDVPATANLWPSNYRPKKILEIHLVGGASPWETFWVNSNGAGNPFVPNKQPQFDSVTWANQCAPQPSSSFETFEFGDDEASNTVWWGPATKPLASRSDIFDRVRMVVQSHGLFPHGAAAPFAITGSKLGRPTMAGSGAAIQHRYTLISPQPKPYSYIIAGENYGSLDDSQVQYGSAIGLHPGFAQPLALRMNDTGFPTLLSRPGVSQVEDDLLAVYRSKYRALLTPSNATAPVRSNALAEYETAVRYLNNARNLQSLFNPTDLAPVTSPICASGAVTTGGRDLINPQFRLAAKLLNDSARHVMLYDGGVNSGGNRNYDMHPGANFAGNLSSSLFRLCAGLADIILAPGETNAAKINLDDVMIVINSEFGRTFSDDSLGGRNHWPSGYASILIGGPITSRGIKGSINPSNGFGTTALTPADLRGAIQIAAGINPFEPENFAVQSFSLNDGTESGTAIRLRQQVLGV